MTGWTAVAGTHEFVVPALAEALAGYGPRCTRLPAARSTAS